MKIRKIFLFVYVFCSLLAACSSDSENTLVTTSTATEIPTSTFTPTATVTNTPTATFTPTPTFTPSPTPTPTEIHFTSYAKIGELLDKDAETWSPRTMAFSPDGKYFALGHRDSYGITVWDMSTFCLKYRLTGENYKNNMTLAFSPDGNYLVSSFYESPGFQLWNLEDKRKIGQYQTFDDSFHGPGIIEFLSNAILFTYQTNNRVNANSKAIQTYSIPEGDLIERIYLDKSVVEMDISPDQEFLALRYFGEGNNGYGDNDITIFTFDDMEVFTIIDQPYAKINWSDHVQFSPDSTQLAFVDQWTIKLWDIYNDEIIVDFTTKDSAERFAEARFTPDGKYMIGRTYWGYTTARIYAWNTQTGEQLSTAETNYMEFLTYLGTPDGKFYVDPQLFRIDVYGNLETTSLIEDVKCEPPIVID